MLFTADRSAGVTAGLDRVPLALASSRRRLVDLATGLPAEAWAGPSRCELWTAHDVLRHVRDACRLHVDRLRRVGRSPLEEPFDNGVTPQRWLEESAGQRPEATLQELRLFSTEEAEALRLRMLASDDEIVPGPYGLVPWTILTAHVFWDAWLHERDIAELVEGGHPSTPVEDAVVAVYALFIASMAAVRRNDHFSLTLALTGRDGHYAAWVTPGHVELQAVTSPPDADLRGGIHAMVDSLAGRGPVLADVLEGDQEKREPLTWLRAILAP